MRYSLTECNGSSMKSTGGTSDPPVSHESAESLRTWTCVASGSFRADLLARLHRPTRNAKGPAPADGGLKQPQDDLVGGALAGAVRSQQAIDLSAFDAQTEIIDGAKPHPAEAHGKILRYTLQLDGRVIGSRSR